jgi:DNA-binding transcriptional LysR family regulator
MSVYDSLEFRHLKYILAVAEAASFTKASARINVAQSAISTQIAEIEDLFEIRLFTRHGKGVSLTVVGGSFLAYARHLLEAREEFIRTMQGLEQSSSRPFALGFTPFIEPHVIATVTRSYSELFPSGEIHPTSGEIEETIEGLRKGSIDAALLTLPLNAEGLSLQLVTSEPLVVCLRKDDPLAQQDEVPPELLDNKLCIFSDPRRHPLAHARLLELLNQHGIRPILSNPNLNSGLVQWMVKDRHCVALIRRTEPLQEDVTWRPIRGVHWTVDFALVYTPEQQHMALPLLLRDLKRGNSPIAPTGKKKPPLATAEAELQRNLPFGEQDLKVRKRQN